MSLESAVWNLWGRGRLEFARATRTHWSNRWSGIRRLRLDRWFYWQWQSANAGSGILACRADWTRVCGALSVVTLSIPSVLRGRTGQGVKMQISNNSCIVKEKEIFYKNSKNSCKIFYMINPNNMHSSTTSYQSYLLMASVKNPKYTHDSALLNIPVNTGLLHCTIPLIPRIMLTLLKHIKLLPKHQ